MPANDFIWFSIGGGANVEAQGPYAADPQTTNGYTAGTVASSPKSNKSWRQGTMASALVGYIINTLVGADCLDNGDLPTIYQNFILALKTALGVPVGAISFFAMNVVPGGYLAADGSSQLRASYPALFAQIGVTFGSADGAHFNLPDMGGYFPRGFDSGGAIDPARVFGSTQTSANLAHFHYAGVGQSQVEPDVYGNTATDMPGAATAVVQKENNAATHQPLTSTVGSTESRPVNVALLACIKY